MVSALLPAIKRSMMMWICPSHSLLVSKQSSMRNTSLLYSIRVKPFLMHISNCWDRVRSVGTCKGHNTMKRVPSGWASMLSTTSCGPWRFTSFPLMGLNVCPIRAKSSRRYSYISVLVPTVLRGLRLLTFCSMAIEGGIPLMKSHSGLCIRPRNWRAYELRLST